MSQMVGHARGVSKVSAATLQSFLHHAESASSFLSIPGMQSYAPQSGQIFGILGQMKEDFEANLSEAQKSEAKAKSEYEMLKSAKQDEIATGKKVIVSTDQSIADFQEKFAQASKELEDTQDQLGMDTEFLKTLEEKCANTDADYDKRVKDRLTEIDAVADTIKILNSDESFEAFDKMVAPTFLQTGAVSSQKERRQRVVTALQRAAQVSGAPQIALIAASAQLDAFTKVRALIDKMVTELAKQQKDEVAHRDECTADLNSNKRSTDAAYDKKESLEARIGDLTKTNEQLTKDIGTAKAAVAESMNQMKRASETREAENADFQTTVNDHRVMSMILTKALDRMKQVYALLQQRGLAAGAPHIQTSGTHTDPGNGPAKFKDNAAKNAGGGRVVAMLEEILADTRKTEDQAVASEQDSQSAYENFMKDSNKSITQTTKKISNMSGARASAREELSMSKTDFSQTVNELEGLHTTNGDLHKACDFVLQNFDARQKARAAEMDALNEAKNILQGAQ
jgi:septal ring factor EnvC (AmiA/AmiB activator)